ncbi:MAG: hypothetical protein EXS51_04205, partial [Candidatus Taylorbacteria bacterium]|nr:hypothetical protein [Candidatus Taylorbacteria bacterium]
MSALRIKHTVISLVLVGLVGGTAYYVKTKVERYVDTKENAMNEKIAVLEQNIAVLQGGVTELMGENVQTALSLKELKNRKDAIGKSQDELLTSAVAKIAPAVVS